MSTKTEQECLRCRADCTPLANLSADGSQPPESFICVGLNKPESRTLPQDRFTLCWRNKAFDERGHWDKCDLLDTMSVISQALSTDENIRVNESFTEVDMQAVNFVSGDERAEGSSDAS